MNKSPKFTKPHKIECLRSLLFWFKAKLLPNMGEIFEERMLLFGLKLRHETQNILKMKYLRRNVHYF